MYKIVAKKELNPTVTMMDIEAPLVAAKAEPGQFIILRVDADGERIPLTIAHYDREAGTVRIIFQVVGATTEKLNHKQVGEYIQDFVGPLGVATHLEGLKNVCIVGGGVGCAIALPIAQKLHEMGCKVTSVIGFRTKDLLILEDEFKAASDKLYVMTDDGSYGQKGLVTEGIDQWVQQEHVDKIFAIGPPIMMKFCSLLAQKHNIPSEVSLNTIMVDGTGMCGACRLTIGGKTRFVCIDGPEFDGSLVDWDEMFKRMGTFKQAERDEMDHFEEHLASLCHADKAQTGAAQPTMDVEPTDDDIKTLTDRDADWRKELRSAMKPKERAQIERVTMPELDPAYRATTRTEEVNCGLTREMAVREAHRCLDCAKPACVEGCPVGVNIPSFIKNIERGQFLAAAKVLKDTSALPAVCGRVCPQEKQCESRCVHLKMSGKAVAIGYLERFAADFERESGMASVPEVAPRNGIKVAVVGSGPSGLSVAGDMAKKGYEVTVFEALHEIGGVLKYGIPEFRLPNRIVDVEIENLRKMGVNFVTDCIVGKTISVEELEQQGFKGIFVGSGAGLPRFMDIPGENSLNIMSSNEYLTRVNLMDAANPHTDTPINPGHHVLVVGGGNTAMDSCRTAKRLGGDVTLVYRRSEQEMPARLEEVKHAKEEGIKFLTLHNPIRYIADENGAVKQAVLQVMELGEPDASGRRSPVPVEGKTVTVDADFVVVAVGVSPNPLVPKSIPGLELGRKNTIAVNDQMQSSRPELFAGGDIVRGGATVILAMGDGRKAAYNMDKMLMGKK